MTRLLSYDEFLNAGLIDIACGESESTWKETWQSVLGPAWISDDEDTMYNAYVEWFNSKYKGQT